MKKSLLLITLLIATAIHAQTVFTVDNNQGSAAAYTSVQAAIDDASAGDIIYLQPSPNTYGDINMTKPLTIYGLGHLPELAGGMRAIVSNIYFSGDASNSKLSGLDINYIYLDNTTFDNHNVIVTNNIFKRITGNATTTHANNAIIAGNYIRNPNFQCIRNFNSQNWIFSNNLIEQPSGLSNYTTIEGFNASTIFKNNIILTRQNGNSNQSIRFFNTCNGTLISNNIFLFTGNNVVKYYGSNSGLNFQNNLTYSYNTSFDALSGSNNLDNTDPLFTIFNQNESLNTTTNNYELQSGSPAENAGADGNNLGILNGSFPFSLRGYPTELPYLTDFSIYDMFINPGQPITINIKANANINN